MDLNYSTLEKYNPWWKNSKAIEKDEKIETFEEGEIKYYPPLLSKFKNLPFGVFTLIGPRQVGKSTLLKLLIRKLLLDFKIEPKAIFFFQCDILKDFQELAKLLEIYLESLFKKYNKLYIFLDEISFVEDWPKAIKHLIDQGKFKKAIIFLSGSLSLQVKGGAEFLPGRRGKAEILDYKLLPINFREYTEIYKIFLPKIDLKKALKDPKRIIFNQDFNEIYKKKVQLENLFEKYLLTGGFLKVINEYEKNKKISDSIYQIYWQWIKGDLLKLERKEYVFLETIQELIKHLGHSFSYNDIAKNISIQSHTTVADYLDLTQKLFIISLFPNIDLFKKLPTFRKQKKFTFIDPFLFHLINGQILGGISFEREAKNSLLRFKPALIEGIILEHFKQFFPKFGFWKNKGEIDFVGIKQKKIYFVEIKHREKIEPDELKTIKKVTNQGIIISKNEFKAIDNFIILPYWMGLLGEI